MHVAVRAFCIVSVGVASSFGTVQAQAGGPTTSVATEYLMTAFVPLDPPRVVDSNLLIFNVKPGGKVTGKVDGTIMAPSADWIRIMPSGVWRMDARETIETDDKQLIYVTFNGVINCSKDTMDRFNKGDVVKSEDCYFVMSPTFETKSEKYSWLNDVQTVAKMIEAKSGDGSHVTYDIFIVK